MGEAYGLYVNVLGQEKANQNYTRYWHGSMIVIRPLITFTDVNGVRNIGFVAIVILLVILCGILI